MVAAEKEPDGDPTLVYEKGGGWWYGLERTNGPTAKKLLTLCLLRASSNNRPGEFELYEPNEESRKIIEQDDYVPLIVAAVRSAKG